MKKFDYVIKDELGIHARPAAVLVKEVSNFKSKIIIECNGQSVEVSKLFALMGLGVKQSDKVTVTIEGSDEETAYTAIKKFFEEKL